MDAACLIGSFFAALDAICVDPPISQGRHLGLPDQCPTEGDHARHGFVDRSWSDAAGMSAPPASDVRRDNMAAFGEYSNIAQSAVLAG